MSRRILHLVRGEIPAPAIADGDVVLHAADREDPWRLGGPDGEEVTDARLVELLFELDSVAVW